MNTIIPITELRRRFGEIEAALPYVESIILTKKGKPIATITSTLEAKKNVIKKYAGSLKKAKIDWKEVLKRKSRKKPVKI